MARLLFGIATAIALVSCSGRPTASPSPAATVEPVTKSTAEAAAPIVPTAADPGHPPVATAPASLACDLKVSLAGWKTDFSRCSVPGREIASGGPPRDGIPPIDRPTFVSQAEAASWLKDEEPVVLFEDKNEARAYPLQVLIWHEIVNDEVGGRPIAVTFCPLCNTAIAFDRRLDGRVLDFGTTGNLRHSDLVMWDRQTESWWQQITGEAIVGEMTGKKLVALPAAIVSFRSFKGAHPGGRVLSRDTGHARDYGRNPYVGYDDVNSSPVLFSGVADDRLRPMERVVTVNLGGEDTAYPFSVLEQKRVLQDTVGGQPIVVFFGKGTASALDGGSIAGSRDVGATGVFQPSIDGRPLTFNIDGDRVVDTQSGSTWNVVGQAIAGPLAGKRLTPVVHGNHFWFAWAVFKPETRIWRGS